MPNAPRTVLTALAAFATSAFARAQCPTWSPQFHSTGPNGTTSVMHVFDDGIGSAPSLYVAGTFTAAGPVAARGIARWDGTAFHAVPGVPAFNPSAQYIAAMTVFDDGSGPALFAAGHFSDIPPASALVLAKWTGSTWTTLPTVVNGGSIASARITASTTFDDGSGAKLYVGGPFSKIDNVSVSRIACWNGSTWSSVGTGIGTPASDVVAFATFDDGSGPALYAAGSFPTAGGAPASNIAKWDGTSWSALGIGVDARVRAIAVYDDGTGPALFAAGEFQNAGGVPAARIAKWDGTSWSPLGSGLSGSAAYSLVVYDDGLGGGPQLVAGGWFSFAGGQQAFGTARWNGSTWSALGSGCSVNRPVVSLAVHGAGSGSLLYAGGYLGSTAGDGCNDGPMMERWDGTSWSQLTDGQPISAGNAYPDEVVTCAESFDDGALGNPKLVVGGRITRAGSAPVNGIAQWNGASWEPLGSGINGTPFAMTVYDGAGSGPMLYVGGAFHSTGDGHANFIARWDGSAWFELPGGGVTDNVYALAVYDDGLGAGPLLYAGGLFNQIEQTGAQAQFLARWNGATWSPLFVSSVVNAFLVHDDCSGPALFIGGAFNAVSGVSMHGITRWNGTSFQPLGSGMGGPNGGQVLCLAEYDDGSGPALVAGGVFTTAGGVPANRIAKWQNGAWSALGDGIGTSSLDRVTSIAVHDRHDGSRPALYAGGWFVVAGGVPVQHIAKWDGSAWSSVEGGVDSFFPNNPYRANVEVVESFEPGGGAPPILFVGGNFVTAGSVGAQNLAMLESCSIETGETFCFGDGTLSTPCPCAAPNFVPSPSGASDAGCANSFHLDGARLRALGAKNPDDVVLYVSGVPTAVHTQFFLGNADIPGGFPSGDGLRCAGGALVRFGGQPAQCGTARYPNPSLGLVLALSTVSGVTPGGGATRSYQALYRNAIGGFCGAGTYNATNGYRITWN